MTLDDIRCQAASIRIEVSLTAVSETASPQRAARGSAGKPPVTERAKPRGKEEHHARYLWTPPHSTSTHRLFGTGAGPRRVCGIAIATSADGAPALERHGGRAATDTDH